MANKIIFTLKQSENTELRLSSIEVTLPSQTLKIENYVTEAYKTKFRTPYSANVYFMDGVNDLTFLDLLSSIRSCGFHVFASNAYADQNSGRIIKTFYFEDDISRIMSTNQSSLPVTSAASEPPTSTDTGYAPISVSTSRVPSAAVVSAAITAITQENAAPVNNGTGDYNPAPTPYMQKLKLEEAESAKRREDEERSMNEQLLLQRRETEQIAKVHESSKSAHYAKMGAAFVVTDSRRASVRQGGIKRSVGP